MSSRSSKKKVLMLFVGCISVSMCRREKWKSCVLLAPTRNSLKSKRESGERVKKQELQWNPPHHHPSVLHLSSSWLYQRQVFCPQYPCSFASFIFSFFFSCALQIDKHQKISFSADDDDDDDYTLQGKKWKLKVYINVVVVIVKYYFIFLLIH